MKRKSSYDLWILSTIILSFIGLLLALFFALRQPSPQSSAYFTDLHSAIGLRIRSQVRYAGVPVGTILAIETLDWSERQLPNLAVRVRFSLNRKIPQLKTDSFASIASDSPSSEKVLNISPGSPNADPLPQDAPIPPEPYPTHSSPSSQLPQLPQEFSELISSIRQDY
ncbi:MAG: MlaD family protein, partial [Chthoniobacterales bacterium]|nr:MlaD family protein [Chthoniobacterales bacterium]